MIYLVIAFIVLGIVVLAQNKRSRRNNKTSLNNENYNKSKSLNYYERKSREIGLPYDCETEDEFDKVTSKQKPAYKGYTPGILDCIYGYTFGSIVKKDDQKAEFWRDLLRKEARSGNRIAQAALLSNYAGNMFPKDERANCKALYENKLWADAKRGDAQAQYAVGLHLCEHGSQEAIDYLMLAARQGLTDAYYEIGMNALDAKAYKENSQSPNFPAWEEKFPYIYAGAECNNGIFLGDCQYYTAQAYESGSCGMNKNTKKALAWYKKAFANGCSLAGWNVEHLSAE